MDIKDKILNCKNRSEVCRQILGLSENGVNIKKVDNLLIEYGINSEYFSCEYQYNLKPNTCKCCGEKIPYSKKINIFCNRTCSARYNNKGRTIEESTKVKTSKALKCFFKEKIDDTINIKTCEHCGGVFNTKRTKKGRLSKSKYCSEDCRKNSQSKKLSKAVNERIKNGTHNGWNSRNVLSYPEKFFINVLKKHNIFSDCNVNFPINKRKDLNINEPYNYFLDFYFKDKKICLEIDGKQHQNRKKHDNIRDERLKTIGILVYRIEWKSINTPKGEKYIHNEIDNFLTFYNNN